METQMKMPDLTTNESAIRIVRWMARPGDMVQRGQPLLEVETDKATMEVESAVGGVLQRAVCQVDEEVAVGQVIALFTVPDGTPDVTPQSGPQTVAAAPPAVAPAPSAAAAPRSAAPSAEKRVGMFARNRATAAVAAPAPAAAMSLTLSVAQRTAARRLQESKQSIPHFYLQTSFNAARIVERRRAAEPAKIAWDAFFVRAAARALQRFERFRCRFDGERLAPAGTQAIGVAIDVDGELYVIPVESPAGQSVEQISAAIRRDSQRLRAGDQDLRRIHPALMTITNLGGSNVERFIPIINPPEASILGVGRVALTPVAREDGTVVAEHRCVLTLCVDHRVASGKYSAVFLEAIVNELENLA
jgi:pyruvate dehydrogenase E2 component (dihydrolipoamide acetyltransferase)